MSGARRILAVSVFLAILLSVLVGGHVYLARRLVLDLGLPAPLEWAGLAVIATLAALLLLQPLGERLPRRARRWLAWPGSLWIGTAYLLILLLATTDLLLWLVGLSFPAAADAGLPAARIRAVAVLVAALGAASVGVRGALRPPGLRRLEVRLRHWPRGLDGFRIVQISDIHIGPILDRRFASHVVERVNALAPDLIALTGDLVDGNVGLLGDEVAPFSGLRAAHGVFFVTGNHDYFSGVDPWVERVRELGMRVLRNERVRIGSDGACFDLAGVEDHRSATFVGGGLVEDLPSALAGRQTERPVVLLAHDPTTFRQASELGVDLQLSGHTHGGQIWPFGWFVRLVVPWVAGHHRRNASQLYVSRGTGFWGPPMRLGAPSEITEITLRPA